MIRFLSTPSARRATLTTRQRRCSGLISIHALREEGDEHSEKCVVDDVISIHALREEGDIVPFRVYNKGVNFYPRPPRGGRPLQTLSSTSTTYFYPRPPRGGRRLA